MKTTNANTPSHQAARAALGLNNTNKATGRGSRVIAPGVDIEPVVVLRPPWALELDDDEVMFGSEVATVFTNGTGQPLGVGDVVVIDGTNVITTTIPQDTRPAGVVTVAGDDGEPVIVQTSGVVALVTVTAAVSVGNYVETSTTAGAATENVTPRPGTFGVYITPGTAPSALLYGSVAPASSSAFLTNSTGEEHVVTTGAAAGPTETLDLSSANWFDLTLTENCTLTFSNPPASGVGGEWTIILRQGVGSSTVTWPGSVDWQDTDGTGGGSAPTLFTAVDAVDVIVITTLDGGTTYGGSSENAGGTSTASESRILLADGRATPFSFNDLLQMDDGSDFMWSDP